MNRTAITLLAAAFTTLADASARPTDWPGLRGPRYDGGAAGRLDPREGAGFKVAWRSVLGAGYSSVAVAEGRAVTLYSDGKSDVAVGFDLGTGRQLWRYVIAPTLHGQDGSFDGPIATPALAAGRVFGLGPRGQLFALAAETGRELWKVDLVEREGAVKPFYGFGASPLVIGGVLVAQLGEKKAGTVAAFLRERGYRPAGGEVAEGAGWGGWRNRTDRVFGAHFPAKPVAK